MAHDLVLMLCVSVVMLAGGSTLIARWTTPTPGERLVLAWALGSGLLGTLTLLIGLWRFDRWTLLALDAILVLVGARPLWQLGKMLLPTLRLTVRELLATWPYRILTGTILVFALLDILGAETVILDGDVLRYHLAVPYRWLRQGVIGAAPGIPFSGFPMLVQLTYAHALAWGSAGAASLLHVASALLLTIGVYCWTRRSWGPAVAALAALLLLSLTDVSAESKLARIDMTVALYGWGAAICWLRWREGGERGWLHCAAALAGCAAASKYTGLITLVVLALLLTFDLLRRRVDLRVVVQAGTLATLLAAPWYLKNLVLHNNPIFPFGGTLFGGTLPTPILAQIAAENSGYAPVPRTPLNFVLAPLLLTFNQRLFASGRIGPLWLAFGPLWAWYKPKPPWTRGALVWGLIFAPLWFWTSPLVRFLLPVLALWSTLLAAILLNLMVQRTWVRWAAVSLTALWISFALFSSVKGTLPRLPVNLGLRLPATVLDSATGLEGVYSYVDFERANAIAGPLVVFNTAGFYLTRPVLLAGDLGNDPLGQLNERFGGTDCGVLHILLPDNVRPQPDAWIADKIRPWLAQHKAHEVYRRGPVAIYRVDGCVR